MRGKPLRRECIRIKWMGQHALKKSSYRRHNKGGNYVPTSTQNLATCYSVQTAHPDDIPTNVCLRVQHSTAVRGRALHL